jgi:hypothetical protein
MEWIKQKKNGARAENTKEKKSSLKFKGLLH